MQKRLTPDDVAALRDLATAIAQPLNDTLIADICRRMAGAGAITSTAEYQIYRAQALGMSKQTIAAAVATQMGATRGAIDMLFEHIADKSVLLEHNPVMRQLVAAYANITADAANGLLKNLWAPGPDGKLYTVQEAYEKCMDFAFAKVAFGAKDYTSAMHEAATDLAKRGIRTITRKNGRTVGVEYAVRSFVTNRMGALHSEISQFNHDKLGADGWELSAHGGSAPDHEPYQGRQYTDKQYNQINDSLARKFYEYFCAHVRYPIFVGKSTPAYTEAQRQALIDDNARGVTYEGKHYTLAEASDARAKIENAMRKRKVQCIAFDALGDGAKLQEHQIVLGRLEAEYKRFCVGTQQRTRSDRLRVAGFGKKQAAQARSAARKAADSQYVLLDLSAGRGNANIKRMAEEMRLSAAHKSLLQKSVSLVQVTNTAQNSKFNTKTLEITLRSKLVDGEFTHEVGHAIGYYKNVYQDKKFLDILKQSVGEYDKNDAIDTVAITATTSMDLLRCNETGFVSPYQRRIYAIDYDGRSNRNPDGSINLSAMREFFSEGFRAFYMEPELLQRVSPDLFEYIKEML